MRPIGESTLLEEKHRVWLERELILPSGTVVSIRAIGSHDWYLAVITRHWSDHLVKVEHVSPTATPRHMRALEELLHECPEGTPSGFIAVGLAHLDRAARR